MRLAFRPVKIAAVRLSAKLLMIDE